MLRERADAGNAQEVFQFFEEVVALGVNQALYVAHL
jgi:hypothetical protein